jgi:hypothetical protein
MLWIYSNMLKYFLSNGHEAYWTDSTETVLYGRMSIMTTMVPVVSTVILVVTFPPILEVGS